MQKRDARYKFSLYSQLSKSSMHSCSSMGYFVRSISHAAVDVILKGKASRLNILNMEQVTEKNKNPSVIRC